MILIAILTIISIIIATVATTAFYLAISKRLIISNRAFIFVQVTTFIWVLTAGNLTGQLFQQIAKVT